MGGTGKSKNHDSLSSFSFQTEFKEEPVIVKCVCNDCNYDVSVDNKPIAHVQLDDKVQKWNIIDHQFSNHELIDEIKDRIATQYY